jgi:predicted dehydrogenase
VSKTKIGIIGVGFIGEVHLQAFKNVPGCQITAIADVSINRLAEMKGQFDIPSVYTDYGEMLHKEELDGVVIATPDQYHRKPVKAAAAAGLPILLEKPIATTPEDARAIMEVVEKTGVKAVMGFCLRWWEPYIRLKQAFDSDELGAPHTVYARRSLNISEARRFNGRCSVNQYIACHDLDYLLWVLGPDVESVYTVRSESRAFQETGEADAYWNLIRWKNGANASVLINWAVPDAGPLVEDECLIYGACGMGEKLSTNQVRIISNSDVKLLDPSPDADDMRDQARGFLQVIRDEAPPRATLLDGLRAQKLIWAAEESSRTRRPVEVDL